MRSEKALLKPIGSPPPLADLQRWLRWIFTEPRGVCRALQEASPAAQPPSPRPPEPSPRLLGWIKDAPPISVLQRLDVYSSAYFARLLESLSADYRAVRRTLGAERFRELIAHYLMRHPSASPSINLAGEGLPRFISRHPINAEYPFLADLARLEWEVLRCLFSDRLPAFDASSLRGAAPDSLASARLVLDPTVRLLATQWPVDRLWRRRDLPESSGGRSLRKREPRRLLLFRDDSWVQARAIGFPEWTALEAIRKGACLETVCAELDRLEFQNGPALVQRWFEDWLRSGIIKRIDWDCLATTPGTSLTAK